MSRVLSEWVLVEGCFHQIFGVDLSEVLTVKSWRWFRLRVRYLMSTDTPLRSRIAPKPESPAGGVPTFDGS